MQHLDFLLPTNILPTTTTTNKTSNKSKHISMHSTPLQVSSDLAFQFVLFFQSVLEFLLRWDVICVSGVFCECIVVYYICSYEVIAIIGKCETIFYNQEGISTFSIA